MALNLISHQSLLADLPPYHGDRPRMSKTSVPCGFLSSKDAQPSSTQRIRNRRMLQCAAVTGGSKRDMEKLVAKTQHRRPRHRKGMTPSKSKLLEELAEEEETEEDVERLAQLASEDSTSSPYEIISEDSSENRRVKGEDTLVDTVGEAAETQEEVTKNAMMGGGSLVEGSSDFLGKQSTSPFSEAEAHGDEVGASANAIADIAMDTASNTGDKISETVRQVRQDITEVASDLGVAIDKQTTNAITELKGQTSEIGASMNAVADVAMDTTMDTGDKIRETAQQIGKDFAEVSSAGQSPLMDGNKVVSQQAEEYRSQAEKYLEQGGPLEQSTERIRSEASISLDGVEDSVQKAVQESARAVGSIGREAFGMGKLFVDTSRETIKSSSATDDNKRNGSGVKSKGRENGSLMSDRKSQGLQEEENRRFTGFKVLVAGASGRTGSLLVENLVSKGVPVRALVRDAFKARSVQQLKNCEVIEADLYKYETVKKAIGDCNVVICAIGARAFPFDPFSTYQVEYEGVLNLISAAKNQGIIKKFVLISTIGVTYLQLIPLLFWKKQAELYLQRSGLDYTIVRPGGLRNTIEPEEVVMQGPDSWIFGGISRRKVAEVCVSALLSPDASDKIVEVVSVPGSQRRSIEDLFKFS